MTDETKWPDRISIPEIEQRVSISIQTIVLTVRRWRAQEGKKDVIQTAMTKLRALVRTRIEAMKAEVTIHIERDLVDPLFAESDRTKLTDALTELVNEEFDAHNDELAVRRILAQRPAFNDVVNGMRVIDCLRDVADTLHVSLAYGSTAKTFRCWPDTSPPSTASEPGAGWRGSPRKR